MKKSVIVATLAFMSWGNVAAQSERTEEDRAKMRVEMIQRSGDRLAKEFGLSAEKKSAFMSLYANYQQEMFGTNLSTRREESSAQNGGSEKELTAEEAAALIQSHFDRQAKQISAMQERLNIQKKYFDEFAKLLPPNQIWRILNRQRTQGTRDGQQGQRNMQRGGQDRPRGGFGGPAGPRGGFGDDGF